MVWKAIIPFVVAVALGIGAVTVGKDMLNRRNHSDGPERDFVKVVVAAKELQPGATIAPGDLTTSDMPRESLPQKVLQSEKEAVGRVVIFPIAQGQSIIDFALAPLDAGLGMAALVPDGMRAVTVEVNEISGMTGLLIPGAHVDVLTTLIDEKGLKGTMAKTIVQNVKVSAVGLQMAPKPQSRDGIMTSATPTRSVTLIVSPEQAEAIELAAAKGRPRLVLRGGKDSALSKASGVSMSQLLGNNIGVEDKLEKQSAEMRKMFEDMRAQMRSLAERPTSQPTKVEDRRLASNDKQVHIIKGGVESMKTVETNPPGDR